MVQDALSTLNFSILDDMMRATNNILQNAQASSQISSNAKRAQTKYSSKCTELNNLFYGFKKNWHDDFYKHL